MNRSIDYRSDFYSLGVTFYQMLTRQLPFVSKDTLELVHNHLTSLPKAVSEINPKIPLVVEAIINKLLSKTPEGRYSSTAGLKSDLICCQKQWDENKEIKSFELGLQDVQDYLTISQKIYGREIQVDKLLTAFERVSHGNNELVLVSGYSGIGKTSLIKEIYRPVVRKQGYFLSGKYDQLQRTTPYSAIIEAFSEFVHHQLAESEEHLSQLRSSLSNALGNNGQVIINIIPNVELIIGPQPPISDLPVAEAQNRLMFTFQYFVRCLAQADHPLVLFLDDLQWIDNASLQLLNLLLMDNELHHFMMIGAYRDNEVSENHPLIQMQRRLEKYGIAFTNLFLTPLKQNDIEQLISDSLISAKNEIPALANLLLNKTNGNPFFINEFLKNIFHERLLVFSYQQRYWQWDIEAIRELPITDNVIDLLSSRINRLPEKTQKLLELAACIGHTFDLMTLSTINEQPLSETAKYVLDATKAMFIVPVNDNYRLLESIISGIVNPLLSNEKIKYRFMHDRVQQAAYQLIPEEKKQQVHLRIGRLLQNEKPLVENDEQLFDVLNHFNYSLNHVTDLNERLTLAQLNLWAGKKAKISSAYQAATEYLQAGVLLLRDIEPSRKSKLLFSLSKELATCLYLTGEFKKAEDLFNSLLSSTKETLASIEVYKLNCEMLSTLNRHTEAIQLGLKLLASVNIKLPENPNLLHILWSIIKIKFQIGRHKIQEIKLPVMQSKQHIAVAELISQLYNSAFVTNQNLFVLFACTNVRLSLRYGYTDSTAFSCLVYAFTVMHGLNWYKEGLAFSELYVSLSNQYSQVNFAGKNHFILGAFIDPWRSPLIESLEDLYKSSQCSYDTGDIVYGNYCNLMTIFHSYMVGKPLAETKQYMQNALGFIIKTKANDFHLLTQFWEYMILCMTENAFSQEKINNFEQGIMLCRNNTEISFYYSMVTKLYYFMGDYKKAIQYGEKHEYYSSYGLGLITKVEGYFYYSLALSASFSGKNKRILLKKIHKIRTSIQRWATWCPANYKHYLLLLDAEIARINNNSLLAINLYNQANKAADKQNALHIVALINERLGLLYTDLSSPDIANLYFVNAYKAYKSFGALTKVQLLKNQLAEFVTLPEQSVLINPDNTNNSNTSMNSIDMLSLMKSAQAISGEIQLDKLLQKLLKILLQNAGAHRCLLLTRDNESWYVEAEGSTSEQRINLAHAEQINSRTDLPLSLVRYVQRTEEPILLQSQRDFEPFSGNDKYILVAQPQSVLVIPIFYQGYLQSILYLENRTTSQAFKNDHVHILQILSSQAAISLQNARLYYQATHDTLTGLSNRNLLYHMFYLTVSKSVRTKTNIAILFFDLDYFKAINDTLGHEIGDKILLYVAQQLKMCLREEDLAVRLGGDEFVAMVEYTDLKQVSDIADKILQQIKRPVHIDSHEINITASIGISLYPNDSDDISDLLKQADMVLYRVKASGKNHYQFYTSSLDIQIKQENMQEIELRTALENNELYIHYQPVFSAHDHHPTHLEALLRWNHPKLGMMDAKHFIHIAEKSALIIPIGKWVLRGVLEQIKSWQTAGLKPIPVAVNISGLQFKMQNVSELVSESLKHCKVNAKYLQLEFTESVSIDYTEKVLADIAELKSLGVKLILDDFGTYYASLSYLRQGVVDKLKIDQSFVKGIESGSSDKELIIAIVQLAHSLNLKVVAEGVETSEQLLFLEESSIDELQGFYLSRPMSSEACADLLRKHQDYY